MKHIEIPITDEVIRSLKVGDPVGLTGVILTGRDAVHKWMIETFIKNAREPQDDDQEVYEAIKPLLDGGIIYHCGPVVSGLETADYKFVAAGPTTSSRMEIFEDKFIQKFGTNLIIGKGGMGERTQTALKEHSGVYTSYTGGAGALAAERIYEVDDVFWFDELGMPEAVWIFKVKDFGPLVVSMDSHGMSIYK